MDVTAHQKTTNILAAVISSARTLVTDSHFPLPGKMLLARAEWQSSCVFLGYGYEPVHKMMFRIISVSCNLQEISCGVQHAHDFPPIISDCGVCVYVYVCLFVATHKVLFLYFPYRLPF